MYISHREERIHQVEKAEQLKEKYCIFSLLFLVVFVYEVL